MKKFFIFVLCVGAVVGGILSGNLDVSADEKINVILPEIYIKSVNPGYTVDGVQNVGEMIEIGRNTSDDLTSLAGLKIGYTNTSGNFVLLVEFPEYLYMAGEFILLRIASSSTSELAHEWYTKTLALKAGPLVLMRGDEVLDSVCWTGKEGCTIPFDSKNPTTLVRNLETGDFEHLSDYMPEYRAENLYTEPSNNLGDDEVKEPTQCRNIEFSEVLSYYESSQREQFVELHNISAENTLLDGCFLRYKNKKYPLSGIVGADGYYVRYLEDFKLTKNPTTSNILEIVDSSGVVVDKLEYFNGQRKGASFALIGYDAGGVEIWKVTYAPTPGEPNNYQEFRACEEGKVLNEETGNCVKITSVAEKICGPGQYLNILTGRCRKIPEVSLEKKCKEGYELNEETGRCRKIKENDGAEYTLVPETFEEEKSFVALYLVLGVLVVGTGYIVYEFRHEIGRFFRRIFGK